MSPQGRGNRRIQLKTRKSILIVGEGPSDALFIRYLRDLYCPRDGEIQPIIRPEHGGSPKCVVDYAIQQSRLKDVNSITVVMDLDCPWGNLPEKANQKVIDKIGATPCLEGELLRILDQNVPSSSHACKGALGRLGMNALDVNSYKRFFPKSVLDEAKSRVKYLSRLIDKLTS